MLAATFVSQGIESLGRPAATEAARPTAAAVSGDPETVAQVTAAAQIGGGLLLASGKLPRLAAAVLAATVLPANLGSHMFWSEPDFARRAEKRRSFMLDVSLLGGLLIASADTAGKPSLGWLGRRAARSVAHGVAGIADSAVERGGSALEAVDSAVGATRDGARRLVGR